MPLHAHTREQGLNDRHFDRFLGHFREALNEVGVRLIRWRRSRGHQNFLTLDATLSLRVERPIRDRIAMFRWASFPLLVRTFPFEPLDSLAKPTRSPTSSSSCVRKR
jgi:hypothetical protein